MSQLHRVVHSPSLQLDRKILFTDRQRGKRKVLQIQSTVYGPLFIFCYKSTNTNNFNENELK